MTLTFSIFKKRAIITMFHDERLPQVGIRIMIGQQQQTIHLDLQINNAGEINLNSLVGLLKQTFQLESGMLWFYLNHSRGDYELITQENIINVHFTSLLAENFVTFRVQHRPTDELMANPIKEDEDLRTKRHRERIIQQAFLLVEQWRYFYRQGCVNEDGIKIKMNLDQSAQIVGVPRKTLEDYFLLFRMGKSQQFNFKNSRRQGVGSLRAYIREQGKKSHGGKQIDEKKFFRQLRFQLLNQKMEEQIFDILNRSHSRSYSSSDQDMVFQH